MPQYPSSGVHDHCWSLGRHGIWGWPRIVFPRFTLCISVSISHNSENSRGCLYSLMLSVLSDIFVSSRCVRYKLNKGEMISSPIWRVSHQLFSVAAFARGVTFSYVAWRRPPVSFLETTLSWAALFGATIYFCISTTLLVVTRSGPLIVCHWRHSVVRFLW